MKKRISLLQALTIIAAIALLIAVFFLMNYVKYLLNEDARINLTEIVTQNKDVITSNLTVEMNNIELEAKLLNDYFSRLDEKNEVTKVAAFKEYVVDQEDESLVYSSKNGDAIAGNGEQFDLSGRAYFKLGIKGTPNISNRVISRATGEDVFVLCVPIFDGGDVIGTLQKQYTPQQIYDLCSVSLFSKQGSSYIINEEGYILVCSEQSEYSKESDNYYRIIYATDPEASNMLKEDIVNNKSGFMETYIDGKKMFSAYTPIDKIHGWYLISSVSTQAVSPNGNVVVKMFYFVLVTVVLIFALIILYYWRLKRRQQQRLEHIAFVDEVTHGDSYTKFSVNLNEIMRDNPDTPFYICSLDIDNFRYINRFYGYEVGDKILAQLYHSYLEKLLPNECISRITGDHFALLLSDVSAERLKALVNFDPTFGDVKIYISAGIYMISDPNENIGLMLDKANAASHANKGMYFKTVEFYSEVFDKNLVHDEQLKRAVELALANDEILPFFQPKVDIRTKKLVGAEALARWCTSDGKLVSPGEFIPVCEYTGLITLVDMAIFKKTLVFIREHLDAGVECAPISVNFSRMHLMNSEFLTTIIQMLNEYHVPPELIELELTETVLYDNHQTINKFIDDLHAYGLKISMDDFGSGYSSLNMLKDVDIDVIKIDRGFLLDSASNERMRTIFGAIVQMAARLEIKVVVEGVETEENVQLMAEFGCQYAQGYFFARPMDKGDFGKIYTKGSV